MGVPGTATRYAVPLILGVEAGLDVSHLKATDRAAALILVPLWVLCFALAIRTQVELHGFVPVGLTLDDDV